MGLTIKQNKEKYNIHKNDDEYDNKDNNKDEIKYKKGKNIREGLTNKGVKGSTYSKSGKTKGKTSKWSAFISTAVHTILFFWVLFPFFSCQLQLIFDQKWCLTQINNDHNDDCYLPNQMHRPPYYPCKDGIGKTPPANAKYKKCVDEHVKGPDPLQWLLKNLWAVFSNIGDIMGGLILIKAQGAIEDEIAAAEAESSEDSNADGASKTSEGVKSESSGKSKASGRKQKGGAKNKVFVENSTTTIDTKTGKEKKKLLRSKKVTNLKSRKMARKSISQLHNATISKVDGDTKIKIPTNMNYFVGALNKSLDYVPKSTHKNKVASLCCSKFKKYGLADNVLKTCSKKGTSLMDYPPFSWIIPTNFGWPYNYLYDDPMAEHPTAYNPKSDANNGVKDWVMAWMAKTQQRSWSTSRGIWSTIYGFFLPYIDRSLSASTIGDRLDAFVTQMEKDSDISGNKWSEKAKNTDKEGKMYKERIRIKDILIDIRDTFDDTVLNYPDIKPIDVLWRILEHDIATEAETMKKEADKAEKAGKTENDGGSGVLNNIYLDLFLAMLKPDTLRTNKDWFSSIFWNWGDGNWDFWFRWLITLSMPMICGIVVITAWFTGLFTTPLSSFNRYSSFVLPVFGGAFLMTMFNMFWQPIEVFLYILFGSFGERNDDSKCPYNGFKYQMMRNFKAYWPINLFMTLAIIVTSLGTTMIAEKNGNQTVGAILSALFPGLIIIKLLWSFVHWLWYL